MNLFIFARNLFSRPNSAKIQSANFAFDAVDYNISITRPSSRNCSETEFPLFDVKEQLIKIHACSLVTTTVINNSTFYFLMMMMKLPILPCAEKLELVLSTAPRTWDNTDKDSKKFSDQISCSVHILLFWHSWTSLYPSVPWSQNSQYYRHFRRSLQTWLL